jgi:hypothetical protein
MALPDGRLLGYAAMGDRAGLPVLVLHGTPGSSRQLAGGVAPLVPRDPQLPPDRLVTRTGRRSQATARVLFAAMTAAGRGRPEKTLGRFASLLAKPDADLLRDNAGLRDAFLDDLRHPSPTAAKAAARDFWLFARW